MTVCRWLQSIPTWVSPRDFPGALTAEQLASLRMSNLRARSARKPQCLLWLSLPGGTLSLLLFSSSLEMKSKFQPTLQNERIRLHLILFGREFKESVNVFLNHHTYIHNIIGKWLKYIIKTNFKYEPKFSPQVTTRG